MNEPGPVARAEQAEGAVERIHDEEPDRARRDARHIFALESELRDIDDLRRDIIVHIAHLPPGRNVQADAMFDIAAELRTIMRRGD